MRLITAEDTQPRIKQGTKRYVQTDTRADPLAGKGKKFCSCGFRKRGPAHDAGAEHAKGRHKVF